MISLSSAGAALAQSALPAMSFLTAPLVSPSSAQSFYGAANTHTNSFAGSNNPNAFSGQPPEIVETARALKNNPDLIYEYIHNLVQTEFAFGERKGPLGALIDKSGTPFDQNVLFVNLVRQAGYQAQYVIAPVTIASADFYNWTGVSDIQAACQMLSSGGMPAAFNGASSSPTDCTTIGRGAFTSVTILHVYSQVNISGTWYAYDPSFKSYTVSPGLNLISASGLVSGQAAAAAASTVNSGSSSGVNYIHNASTESLDSYVAARGVALLNYIKANAPATDMDGVVGITKIIPTYMPTGGWRNTTPPGYTVGTGVTVTGDMPDQYRTKLSVGVTAAYNANSAGQYLPLFSWPFFVDDIDGRRVGIGTNFNINELKNGDSYNYTVQQARLEVDDVPIQSFGCTIDLSASSTCLADPPTQITLTVAHPYAANNGAFAGQTVVKTGSIKIPTAIVSGWGFVSPARLSKWSNELASDTSLPGHQSPPFPCADFSFPCFPRYNGSTDNFTKQKLAANWLAQLSRLTQIQSAMKGAAFDMQHSIGAVTWSYSSSGYYNPQPVKGEPLPPHYSGIGDQMMTLDIDTAMSLTSKSNNVAARNALARSIALSAAALEGSVLEQTQDLPDSASTTTRFAWANRPEVGVQPHNDNEDPCFSTSNPRPFYDFTGTASSTRMGLYLYEGSQSGCTTAGPTIDYNPPAHWATIFMNGADWVVQQYAAAGFKVTAPAEVFLGPGSRFGPAESDPLCLVIPGVTNPCYYYKYNLVTRQRGGALIATLFDSAGNVTKVANILSGQGGINPGSSGPILKGGAGKQPEQSGQFDPSKAADLLKDRFVDRSVLLGVDLKTGVAGYTTPSLISTGVGKSPYQLDYSLTFRAAPADCDATLTVCTTPATKGWDHNWDVRFNNSGSGEEALGATSPMAAAGTLAAFLVMQDIFTESDRSNMEQDVYAALASDWWRQQMVANVATVSYGFTGKQYVRLVDGSWMAPVGAPGVLTQTGARVKTRDLCYANVPPDQQTNPSSTSRRWDFSGVSFSLREADGEVLSFAPWSLNYDFDSACANVYGYNITTWSYPQGPTLTFNRLSGEPDLSGLTSSLGRSMDFTPGGTNSSLTTVVNGVRAGILTLGTPTTTAITDAAGETWNFVLSAPVIRSTGGYNRPVPFPQLVQVFEPVSSTQAALAYTYDSRGIVETVKDATAIQLGTRGPYSWFIAEAGRGERDDPLGNSYAVYYDTDGDAVRYIDELGRETDATWDGRHRVINHTFPAKDQEQFAYDANDNVVQLIQIPKIVGELPNIVVSATYDPVWNKLASLTDANGNTSNFSYYGSGPGASMMQQAQRPAVGGVRPAYSYQYNSIGLPIQEVDPTGVTTTHGYDSYGNLTSTTTGAAAANGQPALNLTTTFTPDAVGNVVADVDPLGNQTATQYDAMRRKLAEQQLNGGSGTPPLAADQYTYDANGRKLTEQKATGFDGSGNATGWEVTTTTYTPTGKVASVTDPLNEQTTTTYDALDRVYQVTDPVGRIAQNVYDAAGQKTGELRAVGTSLQQVYASYSYNLDGFQNGVIDANGNYTTQGRDGFNRPQVTYYPSTVKGSLASDGTDYEQLSYDANGNRLTQRKRNGTTISYQYDALNRETVKTVPANGAVPGYSVYSTYDLADRPLSALFGSTSGPGVAYSYDSAGHQITEATNGRTLTSAYDAASNRTGITWPDGAGATFSYDALHRMTVAAGTAVNFSYDTLSRRTGVTRVNGTSATYGYDAADRLTSLSHNLPSTSANVAFAYGYTAASQVSSRSISNPTYQWTNPSTSTQNYTADGLNRDATLAATAGGYDANGNLTNDGTRAYGYDEENHLVSVSVGGSQILALSYDPLGRLQQTTAAGIATQFVYDGNNLTEELDSTGAVLRRYVHGPGEDEPVLWLEGAGLTAVRFPYADRQGSIMGWSDGSGTAGGTYTYGPYGERSIWSGSRFTYTGQIELPEAQLYYYKARIYDPVRGWFLQTDPVGYIDDLNLYSYTHNDPVNHTDPTGNAPDWDDVAGFLGAMADVLQANPEIGGPIEAVPIRALARGAESLAEGSSAARGVRAAQIAKNAAQGAEAEGKTAAKLGDKIAGKQVTFKNADGSKTRADFVTKDKGVVETKSGGAQLTKGQQKLHDDINNGKSVTPVGDNAAKAGLTPGQPTRMSGCTIDRPC